MSRKRDKPYDSRHYHTSMGKRRETHPPHPPEEEDPVDKPIPKPAPPPALIIMGLPHNCSVLDLKSRFEIYGSISRIRIDRDGVGCITYRTKDSGDAAIVASHDPSFGITIDSQKVKVLWATDPLVKWREGVGFGGKKDNGSPSSSSKLLRAELPLSRQGRGNKLASTIVNPRIGEIASPSKLDVPSRGREIIAYDDIL